MDQKGISKTLIAVIALIVIAGLSFYWINRTANKQEERSVPTTLPAATAVVTVAVSPISPLSPVNPGPDADPEQIEALLNNGIALYNSQDYIGAIEVFDDVLAQLPRNFLAYNARGTAYFEIEDYNKAIADYSKAIELQPLYADAYYNRGRAYRLLKKYDESITSLKKSIELSSVDFGYRANGNIGLIYHQQGEYDKALEAFAAAISFDDSKADTYYLRGETYTAMGNYEAAISDYEAAISRFSQYDQAYQSLGYARYKTGQFDQALQALDKALELSPTSPTPHFYRMLVYLVTQQADKTKTEVAQGMDHLGTLPEEEQALLFKRILDDLESFAQANPTQAKEVEALINLIPQP